MAVNSNDPVLQQIVLANQMYNNTSKEVDNLLRTIDSSRMARSLSGTVGSTGLGANGLPKNKTQLEMLQAQQVGAFQQSLLNNKNFQAAQKIWSQQDLPIEQRIKAFNDYKNNFAQNDLLKYSADMPGVDVEGAFNQLLKPTEKALNNRLKAVEAGTGITAMPGAFVRGLVEGIESAGHGAYNQWVNLTGSPQEIAEMNRETQERNQKRIANLTPYQQDQMYKRQQGQGFFDLGGGSTGSYLANMAELVGGIAPVMGAAVIGSTVGAPVVGPTVGGALAGGLLFGAQNADAYTQAVANDPNLTNKQKEAALASNAMLGATGTGFATGALMPAAGKLAGRTVLQPVLSRVVKTPGNFTNAIMGKAAPRSVGAYAADTLGNAVENAAIMTANNLGLNATVNAGIGNPWSQNIWNGTDESIATAVALAPLMGAFRALRRPSAKPMTDNTAGGNGPKPDTPKDGGAENVKEQARVVTPENETTTPSSSNETIDINRYGMPYNNEERLGLPYDSNRREEPATASGTIRSGVSIEIARERTSIQPEQRPEHSNSERASYDKNISFADRLRAARDIITNMDGVSDETKLALLNSLNANDRGIKILPEEAVAAARYTIGKTEKLRNKTLVTRIKGDKQAYANAINEIKEKIQHKYDVDSTEQTARPEETTAEQTARPEETTAEQTARPEETTAEQTARPEETTAEQTTDTTNEQDVAGTVRAAINALHLSDTQRSKLFIALNTGAYDPETIIQAAITLAQLGPKSRVKVDNILRDVKKQTESKVREEQDVNDEEETIIPDDDDTLETDKANYKRDTSIPFTTFGTLESILQTYKENPEYGINITEHQKAELLARDSVYTQNEMTLYDLLNLLDVLSKNKDLTVQDAEKQLDFNFDDVQDKQNMEAEAQERTEQTVKHDEEINAEQKTPTSNTGNTGTNSEVGTNPETTARPSAGGDIEGTAESSGTNESTGTGRSELSEQRPLESPETSSTTTGNDTAEVKEQNGDNGGQPTDRSKATNTGTGSTDGQPDRSNGNDGNGADVSKGANGLNEIPVGSDTSTPKERYEADVRGNDKFLLEAKLAYTYFGKSSGKKTEQKMPFGTYTSEDGKSLITPNGTTFTYDNMNSSIKVKYANGTIDPFQIPTRNKTAFENLIASYKGEKKNTVEIKNENNEPAPTIASTDNKFGIPEDDIKSVDIVEVQGKADDDIVFTSQLTLKDGTKLPISIEKTDSDTADIGATVLINGIRQRTNNAGKSVQTPISKVINFKNVTAAEDYIRRFASKIKGEKDVAPQEAFNKNPEQFVKKHLLSDYIEAATVPIENISRGYTIKFKGIAEPVNFEYNNNNISFTVKDVKYTLYKNIDGQGAYNFVKDLVKSINYNAARSSFGNGYYSAGRLLSLDWSKDGGRELYESVGGTTDATDDVMAVRANLKGIVNEFLTKADRQTVETALQGRLDDIIDRAESLNDLNSIKSAIISALPLKSKENFIKESSLHSISKENIEELIDTILDKNGDAYMNHTGFGSSKIVQKSVRALVNEYRQLKKNYPDTVKEVLQEANSDTQDVAKAVSEYEQGLLNKGEDFIRDLEEAGITLPDGYDLADETRMQKVAGTNKADRKNFEVVIKKDDGTDERVHIYVGTRNGKYVLEQQGTDNKWHTREEFDAGTATPKEPLIVNNREFPSESKPKQKIQAFNRKVFSFALPFGHPIKQRGTLTRKVAQDFIDRFSSSLHWADNAHPEWKQEFYLFKNAEEARKNGFPRAYDDAYGMYFYGENGRPGRVVLYLDNISSLEQLAGVLAHETIVHGGLDRLVGKEHLQDMLIASYKTWTPREKELFKKWLEDPENPYVPENASLFDTMNSQVKATLLEEFIAANYSKFRENGTLGGLGRAAYNLRKGFIYRVYDFLKNLLRKLLGISEKESPDLFDARTATGIIRSLERAATEGPGWDKAPVARTGFSLIEDVFDGLSIGYIPSKLEARGANKILSATSGMDRTGLLDKLRAPFSAELDPDFVADMAHTGIEITSNTIKEIKETADLAHAFGYDNVEDFAQRLNIAYQDFGDQSLGREGRAAFLRDVRNPEKRFLWESTIRDVYEGRDTNFGDSVERATIASMFDENFLSEIIRYDTETAAPKASKISKKKIQKLAEEITEADEEKLTGTAKDLWDNTQVRNNSWWLAATTKVAGTFKNITAYADQWFATYFDDPTKSLSRNPLISKLNLMPARTQGVINELAPHLQTIKQSMVETAHRLGRDINDVLTTAGKYATARHAEEANAYLLKNYSDQIADLEKIIKDKKIDPFAQEHKPREQKILDARDRLYIERKRLMDNLETIRDPKNEEHKELMQMRTGTGLTNAEARSIMQEILNSGYTREELDAFSDKLSGFLGSEVLGLAKKHGVVSDDIELPDFKHYVPATSINPESFVADNDATPIFNAGKLYARQGRITVADDGWTATNEAVKRIAKQIGSADFTDALIGAFKVQAKRYATDDPRRGLIATKYADKFGRVLHGDSMDKYRAMKFLEKGGFVCTDKETGDRLVIRFKESGWIDPITGLSGELLNESLCSTPRMDNAFGKAMTGITGGFGQILTRFKPLFAPANMTRDMFERSFAMATDSYTLDNGTVVNGPINAAKFLYNMTTGRIGKMFFDALMGRDNPTAKQYYEEYRNLGGKQDLSTLGIIERPDILNTGSTKPEAVQKLLNKVRVQCPGLYKILGEATPDVAAKALNMLDHWNDYFNSMGGFGQYVTLREAGLTPKAATNATLEFMNLNQTGAATPVLRCLYPFVKPTVQGAANLMRNLGFAYDPRGFFHAARAKSYGYMLGMLAAGSVIKSLVEETLGEDENGNKKIDAMSLDQLASFIPMPIGDNNYFRLNVGFGMPQVVFTTLYGLDRVSRGIMEPGDLAARLALTTVKNVAPGNWPQFNPSENPTAFILQTFAPTFMRPFIESATNTTFTGNTLVYPSADRGKSKAYSGGARAAKVYHNMAQTIFDYTGLDMAPEQVQNIMTNLFVGPFALLRSALEANDPGKTSTNLYKDTHMDPLLYAIGASMHAGKMPNTDMQLFYMQNDRYNKLLRDNHINLSEHPSGLSGSDLTDWQRKVLEETGLDDKDISNILILNAARRSLNGKTKDVNKLLRAGILSQEDNDRLIELFQQLDDFKQSVYASALEALE